MDKWTLSSEDIQITSSGQNMAMDVYFKSSVIPSIEFNNSGRRYLYCKSQALHPEIELSIADIEYTGTPPDSWLLKELNLISAQDNITMCLWGTFADSTGEIPLLQPYSKFSYTLIGPSVRDFFSISGEEGWISSWSMTIFEIWLSSLIELVTGFSVSGAQKPIMNLKFTQTIYYLVADQIKNLVLIWIAGNNKPAQLLDNLAKLMPTVMDQISKDPRVVDAFVIEFAKIFTKQEIKAAFNNLGLMALISRIMTILNFIVSGIDLVRLNGKEKYIVNIPLRRQPVLKSDVKKINVGAGCKSVWNADIYLPDGRKFSLVNTPFDAIVTKSGNAYIFEEITVFNGNIPEKIHLTLTISFNDISGQSPTLDITPKGVDRNQIEAGYSFPAGLGKFIEGLAEGSAIITASVEPDLNFYTSCPLDPSRISQITAEVEVAAPVIKMKWVNSLIGVTTGAKSDLALKIDLPFNISFDSLNPFYANTYFSADYSFVEFSNIRQEGSLITYPFNLKLFAEGLSQTLKPLLDFKPSRALETSAMAGQIYFSNGLSNFLRPLRQGSGSVRAEIIIDNDVYEGVVSPADAILPVQSILGTPVIIPQGEIPVIIEDNLEAKTDLMLSLPVGRDVFINKEIVHIKYKLAPNKLEFNSITINPDSINAEELPVEIVYELSSNSKIVFSPDNLGGSNSGYYYGIIPNFLKAVGCGDDFVQITAYARADLDYELENSYPVQVNIKVAEPAILTVSEIQQEGDVREPFSQEIDLWKTNAMIIYGNIQNCSPLTKLTATINQSPVIDTNVIINYNDTPLDDLPQKGDFKVILTQIQPGSSNVILSASKSTNEISGGPSIAAFEINGISPTLKSAPMPETTGKNNLMFNFYGTYATEGSINVKHPDGTEDDIALEADMAGTINQDKVININEGANTLTVTATNGIASVSFTATIKGSKPEVKVVSVNGSAFSNNKVELYEKESVNVALSLAYCDNADISYKSPRPNSIWQETNQKASTSNPIVTASFPDEGIYKIKAFASNDFGRAESQEYSINQVPSIWTLRFRFEFTLERPGDYNMVLYKDLSQIASGAVCTTPAPCYEYKLNCDYDGFPTESEFLKLPYFYLAFTAKSQNVSSVVYLKDRILIGGCIINRGNQPEQVYEIIWQRDKGYDTRIIEPSILGSTFRDPTTNKEYYIYRTAIVNNNGDRVYTIGGQVQ